MTRQGWSGSGILTKLVALILFCGVCVSAAPAEVQPGDPYQPWARVLTKFVNERGEIDFHALAHDRTNLDAFLDYIAHVSPSSAPESFSSKEAKLAYYINAYNVLAMFNVINYDIPARLGGLSKVRFFGFKRFSIGSERMTLYSLENDVIRPLGDERVHFALNCMAVGCPRLPRAPFRADTLNQQLDEEARRFFGETRNLQVLPDRKLARVSSILKFYKEDFLRKSPTLAAYVNRYASTVIPADYEIEFIDYDWTINDQRRGQN